MTRISLRSKGGSRRPASRRTATRAGRQNTNRVLKLRRAQTRPSHVNATGETHQLSIIRASRLCTLAALGQQAVAGSKADFKPWLGRSSGDGPRLVRSPPPYHGLISRSELLSSSDFLLPLSAAFVVRTPRAPITPSRVAGDGSLRAGSHRVRSAGGGLWARAAAEPPFGGRIGTTDGRGPPGVRTG